MGFLDFLWLRKLKLDNKDPEAWIDKGFHLMRLKSYKKSIVCFNKALELKPDDQEALFNKAVAFFSLRMNSEAEKVLKELNKYKFVIPEDIKDLKIKSFLLSKKGAMLCLTRGQTEESMKLLDKAIKINPQNDKAWYFKALNYMEMEKFDEAEKCFKKVEILNPDRQIELDRSLAAVLANPAHKMVRELNEKLEMM